MTRHLLELLTIIFLQVTVSTPSRTPYTKSLGDLEGKVARNLLGGHAPSIAKAVMAMSDVRECLLNLFLADLNDECNKLCRRTDESVFRKMPVAAAMDFKWEPFITDLQTKSPLLYTILFSIASRSDRRNASKAGLAHYPGICMSASIILKERNCEICGLQSVLSLLLYSCHSEKKVTIIYGH